MFARNLNVFIAAAAFAMLIIATPLALVFMLVARNLFETNALRSTTAYLISCFFIVAILVTIWVKKGLSPSQVNPERQRRHKIGQDMLGGANTLAITVLAGPFLLARLSGASNLMNLWWLSPPVFALGCVLWPIGLFMVWSSRA